MTTQHEVRLKAEVEKLLLQHQADVMLLFNQAKTEFETLDLVITIELRTKKAPKFDVYLRSEFLQLDIPDAVKAMVALPAGHEAFWAIALGSKNSALGNGVLSLRVFIGPDHLLRGQLSPEERDALN